MRVSYRSCQSKTGEPVYEQVGPVMFCCAEMCRRWGVLLGFGVLGHDRSNSREVNLCVPQRQANNRAVLEVVPVEFCPWCGEVVEVCRRK